MKIAARHLLPPSLAAAILLAACSSDKPTGPSSSSLAHIFDSAFVADTGGGREQDFRAQIELLLALVADEGLTPTTVQVTTAGGPLTMQMMALTFLDTTASGTPSDSNADVVGWTADYHTYLALVYNVNTGNGPAAHRIAVTGSLATGPLAALAPHLGAPDHTTHSESVLSNADGSGFVVEGDSVAPSDSSSGNISWSAASRHCAWQHVTIARLGSDSTLACSRATVTTDFSLHFQAQPGVDTSLTRISMTSKAIPAVRLVGLN